MIYFVMASCCNISNSAVQNLKELNRWPETMWNEVSPRPKRFRNNYFNGMRENPYFKTSLELEILLSSSL